ncbi:serine/threonine-protein kinase Nek8 [Schistocerca cancellata]|uniref:serine/threonine-protein kinase Nek8 n=1 Tax=Schistocerca cancellata TaxID=274614 RepID=UPI002117F477|nr:serine/threonine-protein kinase Nek8 [Schistocerca cancellata]
MLSGRSDQVRSMVLASSRAPHLAAISECVRTDVTVVSYKYDAASLDHILQLVQRNLGKTRVERIAMMMHCSETDIFLSSVGGKVLSVVGNKVDSDVRIFLRQLITIHMDRTTGRCRLDFLNAAPALHPNGLFMAKQLEILLGVPVGLYRDFDGADDVSQIYFFVDQLKLRLQSEENKLDGYEKLRVVGKGAFGSAVLYRKVADDTLVVMKEVNMTELNAVERQAALNEVQVLSMLHHPNIIRYLGSFEREGILMIEMEYADGGTLAQMLSQRTVHLNEREIILLFQQIVSAIQYMHHHNILHRDLKTANVFLTKDNIIKVGDFGISKMMSTRGQAHTVVGTPYYISPEMCEGKQYGQKSDIWALGCILYEMACLQKTFEGSNLPALVNKIMKGQFQPIPSGYSAGFRQLVHDLLQRDPVFRPSAAEILESRLPPLLDNALNTASAVNVSSSSNKKHQRSVLYDLRVFEDNIAITPIQLPPRSHIKEVACSNTHFIVLTSELVVYTWGEGKKGQLGHGDTELWKSQPEPVEALKGKSVHRVGAGDGYSVFVSDSGMLMTCGDGTFGCLGHGDWNNCLRPKLVENLLSVDVIMLASAAQHVVILSADGDLFSWGRGDGGRLGIGTEDDQCEPQQVPLPRETVVRSVHTGVDCTAIITTDGFLLSCGRNTHDKLGFSVKENDGKILLLKRVKSIPAKVHDISLGPNHTAVLMDNGAVITMGRNAEGQLGRGHCRVTGPAAVKVLADRVITFVKCGPTYTVVGTSENAVYFWGTRFFAPAGMDGNKAADASAAWHTSQRGSHYFTALNVSTVTNSQQSELILEPQEILALYASPNHIEKGHLLTLCGLFPLRVSVMVLVETTAPLGHVLAQDADSDNSADESTYQSNLQHRNSLSSTEYDSFGPIPDWIKVELAQSENAWKGYPEN